MEIDVSRSRQWLDGYARGKREGERFRGELGPATQSPTPRDTLRTELADVLINDTLGIGVTEKERAELRRLAVRTRNHDWDGSALGVMAMLAGRFADPAARAWLAPMLAHAGRYEQAADLRFTMEAEGRPAAPEFVVLVCALAMLGREEEARARMEGLVRRFPDLADDFVTSWGRTGMAREYARLRERELSGRALPTFLHLPFSGGTSMMVSLSQTVPRAAMLEINRRYGLHQVERGLGMSPDDVSRLRFVHLHHPFALTLPERELSYFTVLRDPVSQISSGYHKRISAKGIVPTLDTNRSSTFAEHAEYTISQGLTNMLARQIVTTHPELRERFARWYADAGSFYGIGSEEEMFWFQTTADIGEERLLAMCRESLDARFHVVGSMDHLAASHLAGAASIGLPVARRIVHRGRSGQPDLPLTSEAAERLRAANWVDQTLYEEYTSRFERDFRDLVAATEQPVRADVPAS